MNMVDFLSSWAKTASSAEWETSREGGARHRITVCTRCTLSSHGNNTFALFHFFKITFFYHRWSVTGERYGAGMDVGGLTQQPMDVAGQTGGGAHSVVPQNVDNIIQSVQTVLHLRLKDHIFGTSFIICLFSANPVSYFGK